MDAGGRSSAACGSCRGHHQLESTSLFLGFPRGDDVDGGDDDNGCVGGTAFSSYDMTSVLGLEVTTTAQTAKCVG